MSNSTSPSEMPDELRLATDVLKQKGAMEKAREEFKGPLVKAAEGLRKAPGRNHLHEKWAAKSPEEKRKTLADPTLLDELIMLTNPYSLLKGLKEGFDRYSFGALLLLGVIGGKPEDEEIANEIFGPNSVESTLGKVCMVAGLVQPELAAVAEVLNVKTLGKDQLNQLFLEVREEVGPVPTTVTEEHNKVAEADPAAEIKKAD